MGSCNVAIKSRVGENEIRFSAPIVTNVKKMTSPFLASLTFSGSQSPVGRGRPKGSSTGAKRGRKPKNYLGANPSRVASPTPGNSTVSPVFSNQQYQQVHWATSAVGDEVESGLLQGGISRRNSSQSQVIGTEQGDAIAVSGASVSGEGQVLASGTFVPPFAAGARPPGVDEDGDVDDEFLPAMADDDYSAQQSWNTQSKDNLKCES